MIYISILFICTFKSESSIESATATLALNISNLEQSYSILSSLRKKLHNNPEAVNKAITSNLLKYAYVCVREYSPEDKV